MKKALFLLICAWLVNAPLSVQADNGNNPPTTEPIKVLHPVPPSKPIKRAPTKHVIECTYVNGILTFLPDEFYQVLTVTVSNLDKQDEWIEIITHEDNTIMLEEGYNYIITAATPEGQTFQGYIN